MLVGPGRVETGRVSHAEDRVGAHEIPWEHRVAIVEWVANQFQRIDGVDSAIAIGGADAIDPVHELLILVYALFVFRSRAVWHPGFAATPCNSVSSRDRRRGEYAIVRNVIVGACRAR